MSFTIRWNIRTAHLQGVAERTVYTGDGEDNGSGVVPYYSQSACAALTRSGFRMGTGDTIDTLADALTVLRDFAEARGLKVCANCERAAVAALQADYDVAELKAREAARQLDAAENFEDEPRIAIAEEHAEHLADEYADLAAIIGRCRIFGCEAPTHEASAWCEEHTEPDDIEDTASAIEAETAARHEAAYAARRAIYRTASDLYEEHGGEANRDATAAAWNAFVAAARLAGKCIAFTCYADAEPGADHCQRHRQHVTARLDHTEPGKAIALIDGDHGREHAPQAWLAHEGGSWLLVDDYDGDTLNVKGPDAERAVHAWAALLGLRIDALAVEVEYAGGPVSPPVREPEGPVAPLNWVWVGSVPAAEVHEAHGRAHDYQVTEHADAAGASLVAFLRGTTVDTYRRGYMTADDARKAAESYEARYGSVYVPAE